MSIEVSLCFQLLTRDTTFLWGFLVPALAPVLYKHGRLSLLYEALRRTQDELSIEEHKWMIEEYSTSFYWNFYPQSLKNIQHYFICD
jgi:hypothetical protein